MRNLNIALLLILLLSVSKGSGQNYQFKVKYGMIQAGSASLELSEQDSVLVSRLHIESSPWLSNLWALSDSILSIFELGSGRLQSHIKAIHEGSYHRNYSVLFPDSNRVLINGKSRILDTRGLLDIPSLLHDLSRIHFKSGDTLSYRLWDGRSFGLLELLVEDIPGPSLLRPFAKTGWRLTPLNSTKKSRENHIQLALLLTESFPHIPLRIEIDTKYGSVVMHKISP